MSSFRHVYSTSLSSSLRSPDDVHAMLLTRLESTPTTSSSSASTSASLSKRAARRTLSVLSGLPLDISALIRSHSSSRRPSQISQSDMSPDDDRPSRKSRFEEKIYNFLTRSRSRSRSKNSRRVPSVDLHEPVPDLPPIPHTRTDTMRRPTASKPPSRLPSRPLSSTTTATSTTVTPGTPRPRNRPSAIPVPLPSTRPETPKPSGTRKTLHNLFGIPLSSPKTSSFSSSQRISPRTSFDTQPDQDEDSRPTPKPPKSFSPHPNYRPESPTPSSGRPINASVSSTTTSSTSASSRIHKFFTGQKTPPRTIPSPDTVSGPLRKPSLTYHHRHGSSESNPRNLPLPDVKTGNMGPPLLPPKITHTPATPQTPRPESAPSSSAMHEHLSYRMRSADSGYRQRMGERMAVVDEMGVVRGSGKGKERDLDHGNGPNGISRIKTGHVRGTAGRSTKHGSFDFERPGWSAAGAIQRSGSGGTTGSGTSETGTSGWSRNTNGFLGGIRESAMGPGLAGVGTLQRDQSMKRAKEREELISRAREDDRRKREKEKGMKERQQQYSSPSQGTPLPDMDENGGTSTSTTGHSSSLGRKRGAFIRDGNLKTTRAAFGVTHGRFAFESPVNPTRSTGSTGNNGGINAQLSVSLTGGAELQKENIRVKGEMERERRREKEKKNHPQRDRAAVPVPMPSVGHRSAAKGRSLDLGLGLAWAPTKLKEEALLPATGFFARSVSGSSSQGVNRSVSGSTNASGRAGAGEPGKEKGKSKVGREVADVFRNALDDEGYAAFKKYVHRFDAHDIPFDGPTGIVARVERLLRTAPDLSEEGKKRLLDSFVRIVLQNA